MNTAQLKYWIKTSHHPIAKSSLMLAKGISTFELPAPKIIFVPIDILRRSINTFIHELLRVVYWTPVFKSRSEYAGRKLNLYTGIPQILGPLEITFGDDCRISGQTTFSGRNNGRFTPKLELGSNIDIGWQTTIAVGKTVTIGDNVRIAGKAFLAGYPGHPLEAGARSKGFPDNDEQAKDIVLEDDVWLATNVSVMAGVTIGKGTIVASGSVVTKSLPCFVLAGGNPAKIIRPLQFGDTDA